MLLLAEPCRHNSSFYQLRQVVSLRSCIWNKFSCFGVMTSSSLARLECKRYVDRCPATPNCVCLQFSWAHLRKFHTSLLTRFWLPVFPPLPRPQLLLNHTMKHITFGKNQTICNEEFAIKWNINIILFITGEKKNTHPSIWHRLSARGSTTAAGKSNKNSNN